MHLTSFCVLYSQKNADDKTMTTTATKAIKEAAERLVSGESTERKCDKRREGWVAHRNAGKWRHRDVTTMSSRYQDKWISA